MASSKLSNLHVEISASISGSITLGIIHYFQHFCKSMLGGGGKSSCMLSIMMVLSSVPVHETSLANFFIVRFCEGGSSRGYVKRVRSVRL